MTDALVQINDRLARAARSQGSSETMFFCECGNCLAEDVRLSLDEHEEIRARGLDLRAEARRAEGLSV
jgi:hypothetical protein